MIYILVSLHQSRCNLYILFSDSVAQAFANGFLEICDSIKRVSRETLIIETRDTLYLRIAARQVWALLLIYSINLTINNRHIGERGERSRGPRIPLIVSRKCAGTHLKCIELSRSSGFSGFLHFSSALRQCRPAWISELLLF